MLLVVVSSFWPLHAADTARDLAEARKRYDAALAAATKPVRDRYLQELVAMKSRAMSLKDLQLATAVDREIKSLGANDAGDPADFKSQILNTTWTWVHSWERMTFRDKGVATIGADAEYKWRITNHVERVIEGTFGKGRTFKFTFSPDLKTAKGVLDGTTTFDSAAVNSP